MRMCLSLAMLMLFGVAAFGQGPTPKGKAPEFGLASAVEKDGKITIEVFELRETMRMKMPKGGDVFIEKKNWLILKTGTLGKEIRAYRTDGKPASPREVLAALAKPHAVVYFRGYSPTNPAQVDPWYLGMLKEGSIGLAFEIPGPPLP